MTDSGYRISRESALAHKFCLGKGLEIGGAAHNPFGLDTMNVDMIGALDSEFKFEEIKTCGIAMPVDVVAPGDNIPLPDGSQDFIVSSHVLEHFPDPIKALLEWDRLLKPGGIIFAIVPHKERTMDNHHPRTPLKHLVDDFVNAAEGDFIGHYHYWITDDILDLILWMIEKLGIKWKLEVVADVDDKVGNGFTVVVRKCENRSADEGVNQLRQRAARVEAAIPTGPGTSAHQWHKALELQKMSFDPQAMYDSFSLFKRVMQHLTEEAVSAELAMTAGELCFNLGLCRNAEQLFHKAALSAPTSGDPYNNLGVLSYQLGDYATAREYFSRALQADPANENARKNLLAIAHLKAT